MPIRLREILPTVKGMSPADLAEAFGSEALTLVGSLEARQFRADQPGWDDTIDTHLESIRAMDDWALFTTPSDATGREFNPHDPAYRLVAVVANGFDFSVGNLSYPSIDEARRYWSQHWDLGNAEILVRTSAISYDHNVMNAVITAYQESNPDAHGPEQLLDRTLGQLEQQFAQPVEFYMRGPHFMSLTRVNDQSRDQTLQEVAHRNGVEENWVFYALPADRPYVNRGSQRLQGASEGSALIGAVRGHEYLMPDKIQLVEVDPERPHVDCGSSEVLIRLGMLSKDIDALNKAAGDHFDRHTEAPELLRRQLVRMHERRVLYRV